MLCNCVGAGRWCAHTDVVPSAFAPFQRPQNIFADVVNGTVGIVQGFMTVSAALGSPDVKIADNGADPAKDDWARLAPKSIHDVAFPRIEEQERVLYDPPVKEVQIVPGGADPAEQEFPVVEIPREGGFSQLYLFKPVLFYVTEATQNDPEYLVAIRKQVSD